MKTQSSILVKKFGGTSVGSIGRIEQVANRVVEDYQNGPFPVIVASAMSGETNRLVQLGHEVNPHSCGSAYDMLLASGEQVSIALLSMAIEKKGLKAQPLLAHQMGLQTDSIYSKAKIQAVDTSPLFSLIKRRVIPIVAGFQGVSPEGLMTTLGRGGSDTTAVALASVLKCEVCEIYTDVPAIFSADPKLVPKAREVPSLSFSEMMEMASLGSKVLHFRCVELAAKFGVKIHVRSTFERRAGTWVVPEIENTKNMENMENMKSMENPVVSAVTHEMNTAIVKAIPVPEGTRFLSELFYALSRKAIVVDIISQSQMKWGPRLAFSVSEEDLVQAEETVKECADGNLKVHSVKGVSKISIIGVGMRTHSGVAARFFDVMARNEINLHLVTTSDIKISAVIDSEHIKRVAPALHTEFRLDQ